MHIMALLRPTRSMRKLPSRMEVTQPRGNTEAIQLPTERLKSKSQSSLQSEMCGRTGDVHASPLPWANAPRHAAKKTRWELILLINSNYKIGRHAHPQMRPQIGAASSLTMVTYLFLVSVHFLSHCCDVLITSVIITFVVLVTTGNAG